MMYSVDTELILFLLVISIAFTAFITGYWLRSETRHDYDQGYDAGYKTGYEEGLKIARQYARQANRYRRVCDAYKDEMTFKQVQRAEEHAGEVVELERLYYTENKTM